MRGNADATIAAEPSAIVVSASSTRAAATTRAAGTALGAPTDLRARAFRRRAPGASAALDDNIAAMTDSQSRGTRSARESVGEARCGRGEDDDSGTRRGRDETRGEPRVERGEHGSDAIGRARASTTETKETRGTYPRRVRRSGGEERRRRALDSRLVSGKREAHARRAVEVAHRDSPNPNPQALRHTRVLGRIL